jgi:hypothetical protein
MTLDEISKKVIEKARNDWKNGVIQSRIAVLKAMDETIRNMNDENAMEPWLMCGVPDGACEEDYEDIASDHESYIEMVGLFAKIVKDYAEEDF